MTIDNFASLLRRADAARRREDNPVREAWWTGYMRGLRRAHHGETFGTAAEHDLWYEAVDSPEPMRAALGNGYRAGLTGTTVEPPPAEDEEVS